MTDDTPAPDSAPEITPQGPTRAGFVALIGEPNAGKSTLLNRMVGAKVSIVTHKVQTTRARIREALAQPPAVDLEPPAPQEELDGMIAQLDAMLQASGFYHPPDRTPATQRTLRTLLTKPGWSSQEVRTLRGVLSALGGVS